MHILPKFLFKVRHYGKLSNPHRAEYLERCKKLLGVVEPKDPDPPANDDDSLDTPLDAPIVAKVSLRCCEAKAGGSITSVSSVCGVVKG